MLKSLILPFLLIILVVPVFSQERQYDNVFFVNGRMDSNYFYSKSSFTFPSSIKNSRNKLSVSKDIFFTPGNSLQLSFANGKTGTWTTEINKPEWRGQDKIKEAEILSFAVNIPSGTDIYDLPSIQIRLSDSSVSQPLPVVIIQHNKLRKVLIPLKQFTEIKLKNSADIKAIIFSQNNTDGKEAYYVY